MIKHVFSIFLLLLFSGFSYGGELSDCDKRALGFYKNYRATLLDGDYNIESVKEMLRKEALDSISQGKEYRFFMALRIGESKVSNLLKYNVHCTSERIYLKFITKNFNEDYINLSLTLGVEGDRVFIIDSSDDKPGTSRFKDVDFKAVPYNYFSDKRT